MKDYFETLGELKKAGVKGLYGEIYDYYDLPLEKEFEQFYCFCQEYVDRKDLGFNIRPALVYYNTNVNLNAVAWLKDGIYLIEIFKGTMFHLHEFYTGKSARFEQDQLRDYSNLLAMDGISGGVFSFSIHNIIFLIPRSWAPNSAQQWLCRPVRIYGSRMQRRVGCFSAR